MPVLMPTPRELENMTAAQRDKARRALWRILQETDRQVERQRAASDEAHAFGEYVRQMARDLERYAPTDPPQVIAQRRQIALEAMK